MPVALLLAQLLQLRLAHVRVAVAAPQRNRGQARAANELERAPRLVRRIVVLGDLVQAVLAARQRVIDLRELPRQEETVRSLHLLDRRQLIRLRLILLLRFRCRLFRQ